MSAPLTDLIAIRDLTRGQVDDLLDTAREMLPIARRERASVPTLRGRIVCNLFLEESTRTRLSFDLAAKRLSADVVDFRGEGTSAKKGESLLDTAETLMALGVDLIVLRTASSGAPVQLAREVEVPVLNAGDGWHQHPTQALLDALTIIQRRGTVEGARVTIVGDVLHSRVARSEVELLGLLGASVTLVAPPTLLPPDVRGWGVRVATDIDSVLPETDVLYVLRVQHERMHRAFFPSTREYTRVWGIGADRMRRLPDHALLMHPGPVNRGIELSSEAMEDPRSVISAQVTNGIAVRMACLYRLLSNGPRSEDIPLSELLISGGRVIDPASGTDARADILVRDGVIASIGDASTADASRGADVLDADGCWVTPGLIDLHTHLREPGGEGAEDIATGSAAAAAGGYTAVSPMANTHPVADTAVVIELVLRRGREVGLVDLLPVASITRGLDGAELTPIGELATSAARVDFFSDDGIPVGDSLVMRRALQYASAFDVVLCNHSEDPVLTVDAQMNEGAVSALLGLPGWPREAEEVMLARDLILAHGAGARLHVPHVTTAGGADLIRRAKQAGTRVTAEVTPHHLTLSDTEVAGFDTVMKVNPPLRTQSDVDALREALVDGTIDAVATDHAPHGREAKRQPWGHAPCGMLGLETAFAIVHTELVRTGAMDALTAVARFTTGPASVRDTRGHGGPITVGSPANLQIFDPSVTWVVDRAQLRSSAKNTPFHGRTLVGRARHTVLHGRPTLRDGVVTSEVPHA